jgi:hypothetical protein
MTPFSMRRVTLAYARRHLGALLDEVRDRGPVFIKVRGGGRRHGAVLCSLAWVLDRVEAEPSTDEPTAPEPSPIFTLEAQRERAVTPSVSETQAPRLNMTTIDERIAALKAARALLESLAQAPDGSAAARYGRWYLQDYPQAAEISRRLSSPEGYGLLLAVRRIERVRELIDRLADVQFPGADVAWADEARRIARHYPEPHELVDAVRSPHGARVWAAFYLDRAPGRSRLLLTGQPPDAACRGPARREAWRRLPSVLAALERDPNFPPWGVAEARWVLAAYPRRGELGCRLSGLTDRRFHEVLEALERACQLIEAVVGGTFFASLRQHARAQRISRHLPHSEDFPLTSLGAEARQAWVTWLFASRNGSRPSRAAPPNSSLNN